LTPTAPVTVIIPTFNCQQWVGQAIDSALDQTVAPAQVIVVDDGSTDGTGPLLAKYGERIHLLSQDNRGVAAARNRGLAEAGTEWIAFLDADDVWHPRKLELQLRLIADRPDLGLLGTGLFAWPCESIAALEEDAAAPVRIIDREQLAVKNCVATSSILIRRHVARRVGGFDTELSGPEDHDYWMRAAEIAIVGILPIELTGYRSVPGSLSKRAASMEAGMKRTLRKLDARDFWRGDRMLRRRAYGYVNYSCAYMHGAAGDYAVAIRKLIDSIAWYPLPARLTPDDVPFGRARRLAVLILRLLRMMRPDPNC
jgi:glycosyltransferase involved in cell wall biosynthesis